MGVMETSSGNKVQGMVRHGATMWSKTQNIHNILEVGAVEAGSKHEAPRNGQLLHHVVLHPWGGRGSERHHGHRGEAPLEDAQALVVGSKVVAPCRDAVGLCSCGGLVEKGVVDVAHVEDGCMWVH